MAFLKPYAGWPRASLTAIYKPAIKFINAPLFTLNYIPKLKHLQFESHPTWIFLIKRQTIVRLFELHEVFLHFLSVWTTIFPPCENTVKLMPCWKPTASFSSCSSAFCISTSHCWNKVRNCWENSWLSFCLWTDTSH